ncbi:sulfurtransferase TusA family protein [Dactylosporangium sp. CA-092794]|uniref:sulfurtransferase TusA family protein n=1 Tax=Dactylosporangium sp. CA-092794 TaxID=3239929 RepID=UPI003D91079D
MSLVIDALGKKCPLPVIMLAKAAGGQPAGTEIAVLSDDPAAAIDIPAWCRLRGHTFLSTDGDRHTVRLEAQATGVRPEG